MTQSTVTFQVLEGIDKGRIYRELSTPVTIGREEGNQLRLNDERVSRFHAKVQIDHDDYILTDLESTNGTRVNGSAVQIRRLRYGDRVSVGRSVLLFGSSEEIAARMAELGSVEDPPLEQMIEELTDDARTVQAKTLAGKMDNNLEFELNVDQKIRPTRDALFIGKKALPPLPLKLNASQAARLAEILDFLHKGLAEATDRLSANDDGTHITLEFADWQRILAVQMLLGRYQRLIGEPQEPPSEDGK